MASNYIVSQILTDKIDLKPSELNSPNIVELLVIKLKNRIGNKIYNNGYILKNSITFIGKTMGKIVNLNSINKIEYTIKYSVRMILPTEDDIISCYIDNKNKMGIIAYIKTREIIEDYSGENTLKDSPLLIIIPNETIENPERYNIGSKIQVRVLATRSKINNDKIQVIGVITD
tara:strand:+ start:438 stop:959 length:522 start_codon:yes stop_codon:yes gene_type:complete